MDILLDTNALIWLLDDPRGKQFGPRAKKMIQDAGTVYVSSVSLLEIRIKTMLGKLVAPDDLLKAIAASGLVGMSFEMGHADAVADFPDLSKHDPFDRMLLAQAKTEGVPLMTSDGFLQNLDLDFVLNARN